MYINIYIHTCNINEKTYIYIYTHIYIYTYLHVQLHAPLFDPWFDVRPPHVDALYIPNQKPTSSHVYGVYEVMLQGTPV